MGICWDTAGGSLVYICFVYGIEDMESDRADLMSAKLSFASPAALISLNFMPAAVRNHSTAGRVIF